MAARNNTLQKMCIYTHEARDGTSKEYQNIELICVFFVIAVLLFILTGNVLGFGVFLVFQRLLGVGDGGGRP